MATLYAAADGRIVFSAGLPFSVPISPPVEGVQTLEFDPDTNPQLVVNLKESLERFRLNAGVLTRDGGIPVVIASDSNAEKDRKLLQTIWTALNDPLVNLSQTNLKTILRLILRHLFTEFRNQ